MARKLLTFLVPAALLVPAYAAALSGDELYEMCSGGTSEVAACTLYVRGVSDTMQTMAAANNGRLGYCPPKNTAFGEMVDLGIRSIRKNPEHSHLPAPAMLAASWVQAYPCKNNLAK